MRESVNNFFDELVNIRTSVKYSLHKKRYDVLAPNIAFKNSIAGKRCFILGNGPSIVKQDISLLRNEYVITVNQAARLRQFPEINTNIHFWADMGFFNEDNLAGNEEFIEVMKSVNKQDNIPICFFPIAAKSFVERHALNNILNVRYFAPAYILTENYNRDIDFTRFIPGGYTVIHSAIALAVYMGASEIYLLGCDSTGIITYIENLTGSGAYAYAYNVTEQESKHIEKMHENDSNEKCFDSFTQTFRQYRRWHHYCENRDIKLVNCSAGGILNELPREKFEDVIIDSGK